MSEKWIRIPLAALGAPSTKVAVSLPEVKNQTNNFSTKNRPGCVPTLIGSDPKELFLHYNVTCKLPESDPAGHEARVKFDADDVDANTLSKNLDVEASCTCPAFLYWGGQWNMYQRDALEGQPRPLLAPPTERLDLRANFLICKHLAVIFDRILPAVQHNINKIVREQDMMEKVEQPPAPSQRHERTEEKQEEMYQRKQKEKGIEEEELPVVQPTPRATPPTSEVPEEPVKPVQPVTQQGQPKSPAKQKEEERQQQDKAMIKKLRQEEEERLADEARRQEKQQKDEELRQQKLKQQKEEQQRQQELQQKPPKAV